MLYFKQLKGNMRVKLNVNECKSTKTRNMKTLSAVEVCITRITPLPDRFVNQDLFWLFNTSSTRQRIRLLIATAQYKVMKDRNANEVCYVMEK